jgi:hypothetical protein
MFYETKTLTLEKAVAKTLGNIYGSFEEDIKHYESGATIKLLSYSWKETCRFCGKETSRFAYVAHVGNVCNRCYRKYCKAILISINLKKIREKRFSKGNRFGYKMAMEKNMYGDYYAKITVEWLEGIIREAKDNGKNVFFLGRDMDMFYVIFQLEDNVKYFSGWNREFTRVGTDEQKLELLLHYGVKDGDYFVDTGFVGSILRDINNILPINGFLLSSENYDWRALRAGDIDGYYRAWVCNLEHISRAREVKMTGFLPMEVYEGHNAYENGFFAGFRAGVKKLKEMRKEA